MKTLLLLPLLASLAFSQSALSPSAAQHKKLLARRAEILKTQFRISQLQAQVAFQTEELEQMCRQVALENHWPSNVGCDKNTLLFYEPAVPSASAPRRPEMPTPSTPPADKK